jgi:hypothetical protein
MQLDLSRYRYSLFALAAALLLVSFAWLGHAYLPAGDRFLGRTEWQVLKAGRAYQKELSRLQAATEDLTALLNNFPDPVRAQLVAEHIQRLVRQGQPALTSARENLSKAAQAVSDWAVGAGEHETARQALDEALQMLFMAQPPLPTPSMKPIYAPLIWKP